MRLYYQRTRAAPLRPRGLGWCIAKFPAVTQLRAVAIAAFFLGLGMAGQPFELRQALLALALLLLVAVILELLLAVAREPRPALIVFLFALAGVLLTCDLQHGEVYPGTGIVGIGLGGLAAASYGRKTAPAAVAVLGTLVGTGIFFLL
jgi:hypothetical protein